MQQPVGLGYKSEADNNRKNSGWNKLSWNGYYHETETTTTTTVSLTNGVRRLTLRC